MLSYLSDIYKSFSDATDCVLMIGRTKNVLMALACFFAACSDVHPSHTFGCLQFDIHQAGLIALWPTSVLDDMNFLAQQYSIHKAGVDVCQNIFVLHRSLEVNFDSYAGV